jgi:hypothetical protein
MGQWRLMYCLKGSLRITVFIEDLSYPVNSSGRSDLGEDSRAFFSTGPVLVFRNFDDNDTPGLHI